MTDADPFDEIVRHLDFDLEFPAPTPPPPPRRAEEENEDEPFYRRVEPRPLLPRSPRLLLAWIAVLGTPVAIMACSFAHVIMPRPVLLGCGFVFVAGAVYLISRLPERGPAEPWWPDDGAEL